MGRWAQNRRRGTAGDGAPHLTLPPAPVLTEDVGNLIATPQGDDDTGGTITLQTQDTGTHIWSDYASWTWDNPVTITTPGIPDLTPCRAYETGNGSIYAGQSPPSNVLLYAAA